MRKTQWVVWSPACWLETRGALGRRALGQHGGGGGRGTGAGVGRVGWQCGGPFVQLKCPPVCLSFPQGSGPPGAASRGKAASRGGRWWGAGAGALAEPPLPLCWWAGRCGGSLTRSGKGALGAVGQGALPTPAPDAVGGQGCCRPPPSHDAGNSRRAEPCSPGGFRLSLLFFFHD